MNGALGAKVWRHISSVKWAGVENRCISLFQGYFINHAKCATQILSEPLYICNGNILFVYKKKERHIWRHFITLSDQRIWAAVDTSGGLQISFITVETLYSTIYYSKYFIELNFDKSTQYVALWTHKRHPIPRPFGRAMECLLWVFQQKLTVL